MTYPHTVKNQNLSMWHSWVYIRGGNSSQLNYEKLRTGEKILAYAAAILGLGWILKAKAAGNLIFFPGNIVRVYFEGSTPVFEVSIIVQNTSAATLTLSSFAANVLAKQMDSYTVIGNLSGFQPIVIRGNSEGAIIVKLRLFPTGIVTDIVRAWSTKNYKQDIFIAGGVHVAGIPPVRIPIEMVIPVGAP